MLSLITIIGIIIFIVFLCVYFNTNDDNWCTASIFCGTASGFVLIAVIVGIVILATAPKIDRQIEMYTEENQKLELQIDNAVEEYLKHEEIIYDLDKVDPNTLLIVLPELNGNELVKAQIDVYIENNNKIKELKDKKINLITWRFLIYFGG